MKTDVYKFERSVDDIDNIVSIVEKTAAYNSLDTMQTLRLTLLSEELVELLPNLLICGEGSFWIENKGMNFEIHAAVRADDLLSGKERKEILSVSTSGKNAAAVGIVSKIKIAAETMFANYALSVGTAGDVELEYDENSDFTQLGMFEDPIGYSNEWSLVNYKKKIKNDTPAWDELEKSIIANMADDVVVGIKDSKVEITIKKKL
ncbi:MAG: hypothetical protein IK990_12695 [Ruminiclostridium sp.]|nr:hypothetical protein [Ruminiclostridium sp.]